MLPAGPLVPRPDRPGPGTSQGNPEVFSIADLPSLTTAPHTCGDPTICLKPPPMAYGLRGFKLRGTLHPPSDTGASCYHKLIYDGRTIIERVAPSAWTYPAPAAASGRVCRAFVLGARPPRRRQTMSRRSSRGFAPWPPTPVSSSSSKSKRHQRSRSQPASRQGRRRCEITQPNPARRRGRVGRRSAHGLGWTPLRSSSSALWNASGAWIWGAWPNSGNSIRRACGMRAAAALPRLE